MTKSAPTLNAIQQDLNTFLISVEKRGFRMAKVALGNSDDALDVVQDVMLKLCSNYANKPHEEWRPLFFRMLNNRITDFQRKQILKKRLFFWQATEIEDEQDLFETFSAHESVQPDSRLESEQRLAKLEQQLAALPQRQREAFFLRCWEGCSTEETADIMGCTSGSVKTHYSRALTRLKEALEGDYYERA